MDHSLPFDISITDTHILLCFDKTTFPTEVAGVERAYQYLQDVQQIGDRQHVQNATR
jgi:hypothetical protein